MDDKEIIRRAISIVTETRAGLLATVGLDGAPNLRWMATHSLMGSLDTLYTITAPASNKVREIEKNPAVTWLFTRVNFNEILKLHGVASLEDEPLLKSQIWDIVGRKTWRYFTINRENPEFLVLVTKVRSIEYYAPQEGVFEPLKVKLPAE